MRDAQKSFFWAAVVMALGSLALGLIVLAGWLSSFQLDKNHASFWDIAVKGVAGLVALLGAAIGFSKYLVVR